MTFNLLLYFTIVVIHDTNAKNVLTSIGEYADMAADIVSVMYQCEFNCPSGEFRFGVWCYKTMSYSG